MILGDNKNYNLSFAIIIICTLIYTITFVLYKLQILRLELYMGLNPLLFFKYKHYWSPVTYIFVHGNIGHLFFNMFALFMFGHTIEEKMGSKGFILYFLTTGILAGIFSLIFYTVFNLNILLIGASGAIYAVLFAYAVFFPNRKIYFFGIIPVNPPILIILYTVFDLYSQFFRNTNIAHITHLSGFLFAFIYFKLVYKINPLFIFRNYKRYIQ